MIIISPSMAYLVLAQVKLVPAIILPNEGVDMVVLASNGMSIRSTEQLVPSGQLGKVVGITVDVRSSVGHDDKGLATKVAKESSKELRAFNHNQQSPYRTSRPLSIITTPLPLSLTHLDPLISDLISIHLIHVFTFLSLTHFISHFLSHLLYHFNQWFHHRLCFWYHYCSILHHFLIFWFIAAKLYHDPLLPETRSLCSLIYLHTLTPCGTQFSSYFLFLH